MPEGEKETGKKDTERRVYTTEFKTGAAAPAEKHGKPVSHAAANLGINENVLYRQIQRARESAGTGLPAKKARNTHRVLKPALPETTGRV
ncbi:MAG: transposase [Treponema sp.]|nr:transposase [Treponema sp.]